MLHSIKAMTSRTHGTKGGSTTLPNSLPISVDVTGSAMGDDMEKPEMQEWLQQVKVASEMSEALATGVAATGTALPSIQNVVIDHENQLSGKRGRDDELGDEQKARKRRACLRCSDYNGDAADTCKGRGGRSRCQYFEDDGTLKAPSSMDVD